MRKTDKEVRVTGIKGTETKIDKSPRPAPDSPAGRTLVGRRDLLGMPTPVSLGKVLEAIGPMSFKLIRAPLGTEIPALRTTINDPCAPPAPADGSILLGVGIQPNDSAAIELIRSLPIGYSAVVVKSFGGSVSNLADAADVAKVALIVVDDALAWDSVGTLIHSALSATARPEGRLADPASNDLFALANSIAASVGGAVAIEDLHQHILSYSTLPEQPIDDERRAGILWREVPDGPENAEHYRELYSTYGACQFTSGAPSPRIAIAVRAGYELLGSIWVVDARGDLGEDAALTLEDSAALASLYLLRARAADDLVRLQRGNLLRRLLEIPEDDSLIAPQLGLTVDDNIIVVAFAPRYGDPDGLATARVLLQLVELVGLHCEARYGRHGCVLVDGTVYVLLPAAPGINIAAHTAAMRNVAQLVSKALQLNILAGVGSEGHGLREAASSRKDADMVLRVLNTKHETTNGNPQALSIADIQATVALLELSDLLSDKAPSYYDTGTRIISHDMVHDTRYAQTLLVHFECESNISATASVLNVHPNTCRYRLSRANELFDCHLDSPDSRLLLWLQLRLASR